MIIQDIEKKLNALLNPEYLTIIDESSNHAAHYKEAEKGETHFLIKICASSLDHLSTLQKHQRIYAILEDEIKKIHSLSIRFQNKP